MTKKNKKLGRKYINHKKAVKGRRCSHGRNTPIDAREVKIDVSNNLPFTSKHFLLGTMKWNVKVFKYCKDKKSPQSPHYLSVHIENQTKLSSDWRATVCGEVYFDIANEKHFLQKYFHLFHQADILFAWNEYVEIDKLKDLPDGEWTMVVTMKLINARQELFRSPDFHQSTPYTDSYLIVEGKKFFVNKTFLAYHSKFFERMFGGDFRESSESHASLSEVKYKDFYEMLCAIHIFRKKIEDYNVISLWRLSDMYQVDVLNSRCEKYLSSRFKKNIRCAIPICEKLEAVEQPNCPFARALIIQNINDLATLNEVLDEKIDGVKPWMVNLEVSEVFGRRRKKLEWLLNRPIRGPSKKRPRPMQRRLRSYEKNKDKWAYGSAT